MKKEDIKRIAEVAKAHGKKILEHWLPGGKIEGDGKEYAVKNPHRQDNKIGSLKINVASGRGKDFATDEAFGDFVAVVAFAQRCDMSQAASDLASFIGMNLNTNEPHKAAAEVLRMAAESRAIMPVPNTAPPPPVAHPKRGIPSVQHVYRDAEGGLLGYIFRFEATPPKFPKKDFYPLTLWDDGTKSEWRWKSFLTPRPLYGLDLLAEYPDVPVVVVEGEKAADAGRKLSSSQIFITWPGGSSAVGMVDFKPLIGRHLVLWPDNDEPGIKAMQKAAAAAGKAGAASCRFLNLEAIARLAPGPNTTLVDRLGDMPVGWDCADALAEDWSAAHFAAFMARDDALHDSLDTEADFGSGAVEVQPDKELDGNYALDESGLHYLEAEKEGGRRKIRICAPLSIPALARDGDGGSWSPVLEFRDRDKLQRREIIPFKMFVGDGTDGVKQLADLGLEIASGRQSLDRLKGYIVSQKPERRARLVDQSGWHGNAYLFPEGAIGETDETLLYKGSRRALGVFSKSGNLKDWQDSIGQKAVGNERLMFVLSVAFAGPLLKPCGAGNMAFHLVGDSSIGKSGGLTAAGSVWGSSENQVHTWRQTSNALEYTAAQHNDALLILDELKEVAAKEAGSIAYMLSNAKGKGRAHHAGGLRESTAWNIAMLSSGELGLGDHLASAGEKRYAGQEVRFIELAADSGKGAGMWSSLHGLAGGKEFTDALKRSATKFYGTAGRAFIGQLVKHLSDIRKRWNQHDQAFSASYKPDNAGGQVMRVLSSFSLAAFAGEMAAEFGVVPWDKGAASDAASALFAEWLKERPSIGNSEEAQIIAHVRNVLERTWQSRFVDWHRVTESEDVDLSRMAAVHESLGFRKRETSWQSDQPTYLFYIGRSQFQSEFAAKGGFKPKRVAAVLKARGVLRCDADSTTLKETLPNGDPRSYCIIGSSLWAQNI